MPTAYPDGPPPDELTLNVVGQIGGPIRAIATDGDRAVVGVGASVRILDASDPGALSELGVSEPLTAFIEDVAIARSLAFVAAGPAGVAVFDVEQPGSPSLVATYQTPGYAERIEVLEERAYIADGAGGLLILDISEPARPRPLGAVYQGDYVLDVALTLPYAYLAAAGGGLLIADVSDPLHPTEVARFDTPGHAYAIGLLDGVAYVADGWAGMRAIAVDGPEQMRELATWPTPGWALDVTLLDSHAYVANAAGGLSVIDVRIDGEPGVVGGYRVIGMHAGRVALHETTAFVADRNLGLHVIDVSVPARPRPMRLHDPIGFAEGVTVDGSTVYVAAGRYGLRAVDVADPSRPVETASVETGASAATVTVLSGVAYVTTLSRDMSVVDVSTGTPSAASAYTWEWYGTPRNQAVVGDIVYVADEFFIFALDATDPMTPCLLGLAPFSDLTGAAGATGIAVADGIAYVAGEQSGLVVMDVADVSQPVVLATYAEPMPGRQSDGFAAADVLLDGDVVYVLANGHLRAVDVSNPRRPNGLGFVRLAPQHGWGPFLAMAGKVLYVADGGGGLVAVDVTDPTDLRIAARLELPGRPAAVATDGEHVYVAAMEGGLIVIRAGAAGELQPPVPAPATGPRPFAAWSGPPTAISITQPGALPPSLSGTVCTVTSTDDSGPGTLRSCLAAQRPGDLIDFDPDVFDPRSPAAITPMTPLPELFVSGVTIDGSRAGVVLSGSAAPPGTDGLRLSSDHNVLRGLQVIAFPRHGLVVSGSFNVIGGNRSIGSGSSGEGNVIGGNGDTGVVIGDGAGNRLVGNHIGVDAGGNQPLGNALDGVHFEVSGPGNVLGGPQPGDRNVIAANGRSDVHVSGGFGQASGALIMGNYIGTDATGTSSLYTAGYWTVAIEGGAPSNEVVGNVIAGQGILIFDEGTSYNEIVGNVLGLDASGRQALGETGIYVNQPFNRIGGSTESDRNVINGFVGLIDGSSDNVISGNYIGTDIDGRRGALRGSLEMDGTHNFVGGASAAEGNVIGDRLVLLVGAADNFVASNVIGTDVTRAVLRRRGEMRLERAVRNFIYGNFINGVIDIIDDSHDNVLEGNELAGGNSQ